MEAGNVLYIINNDVESYADPEHPPVRGGRTTGRAPTAHSKTGDLVGRVVRTVKDYNREGVTLKELLAQLEGQLEGTGKAEREESLSLFKAAVKRALKRGFLVQDGKILTLNAGSQKVRKMKTPRKDASSGTSLQAGSLKLTANGASTKKEDLKSRNSSCKNILNESLSVSSFC